MAKLIKILAASFGGGLALGAGIRLGEALASRDADGDAKQSRHPDLESRIESRIDRHEAEVSAIRSQLAAESRQIEALGELGARLHKELPEWIEKSVARRIEEAEADLRNESERSQKQALDTFIDGVQTRVAHRISRLEEEVSMHSAAMTELHACSLRTEASIEKLAVSVERLISRRVSPASGGEAASENPRMKNAAGGAERSPRARRWGIFG